jgi:hypothetical protein
MTTATETHTLSIVGGRPHIDGRPLERDDRIELTAWELSWLVGAAIADFRWSIELGAVEWDASIELGRPAPANVRDGDGDRDVAR